MKAIAVILCLLVAGCGVTTSTVLLNPHGKVQFIENRTLMSTTPVAIVFDDEGRVVAVTSGSGIPILGALLGAAQSGATLGAGFLIKQGLQEGLRELQNIHTDLTLTLGGM